jgi:hypothetical protein
LVIGDLQAAVNIDDVLEAELAREPVRASEGLGSEPRQMVDVGWHALGEEVFQDRVGESLVVEKLLEAVQRFFSAGMLVQRLIHSALLGRALGASELSLEAEVTPDCAAVSWMGTVLSGTKPFPAPVFT